ncbi:MAG: transketolase C-terminal domain-containing protein [Anaerolineales bacterium]|jgi:pyruvate/2-oxoglutarate/acetoin dehydrogenase E1 component
MTTVLERLNHGMRDCLEDSDQVILLGEDLIDPYGGAFKVTRGLSTEYPGRVITTPVSEAGIVGIGTGMALRGMRPIVEIMFGDFLMLAGDQLLNHAAKLRWMSNDQVRVPLVVRTPMGGRRGYGPTHSQSLEKHFLGVPGLRTIALTPLADPAKLLEHAVLQDDDPVLFIEHKLLYAAPAQPELPEFESTVSDSAYPAFRLRVRGAPPPSLTMAAYGYSAELARHAALKLAYEHELFVELVVFTQISPSEHGVLQESLSATGRLLTIEESSRQLGWGAECIADMVESLGPSLRCARLGAADTPIPAAGTLEEATLPQVGDIIAAARSLAAV